MIAVAAMRPVSGGGDGGGVHSAEGEIEQERHVEMASVDQASDVRERDCCVVGRPLDVPGW